MEAIPEKRARLLSASHNLNLTMDSRGIPLQLLTILGEVGWKNLFLANFSVPLA